MRLVNFHSRERGRYYRRGRFGRKFLRALAWSALFRWLKRKQASRCIISVSSSIKTPLLFSVLKERRFYVSWKM